LVEGRSQGAGSWLETLWRLQSWRELITYNGYKILLVWISPAISISILPGVTLGEAKNFRFGVERGDRRFSTNGRLGLPGFFTGLTLADTSIAAYLRCN